MATVCPHHSSSGSGAHGSSGGGGGGGSASPQLMKQTTTTTTLVTTNGGSVCENCGAVMRGGGTRTQQITTGSAQGNAKQLADNTK